MMSLSGQEVTSPAFAAVEGLLNERSPVDYLRGLQSFLERASVGAGFHSNQAVTHTIQNMN